MSLRIKSGNISNPNGSMYYKCNTLFRRSQGRRNHAGVRGDASATPGLEEPVDTEVTWHPQILADQLTLFQPKGQMTTTTLRFAHPDFQTFL